MHPMVHSPLNGFSPYHWNSVFSHSHAPFISIKVTLCTAYIMIGKPSSTPREWQAIRSDKWTGPKHHSVTHTLQSWRRKRHSVLPCPLFCLPTYSGRNWEWRFQSRLTRRRLRAAMSKRGRQPFVASLLYWLDRFFWLCKMQIRLMLWMFRKTIVVFLVVTWRKACSSTQLWHWGKSFTTDEITFGICKRKCWEFCKYVRLFVRNWRNVIINTGKREEQLVN